MNMPLNINVDIEESPIIDVQIDVGVDMAVTLESPVIVAPIPSNYGLITWNGSYLTVS